MRKKSQPKSVKFEQQTYLLSQLIPIVRLIECAVHGDNFPWFEYGGRSSQFQENNDKVKKMFMKVQKKFKRATF